MSSLLESLLSPAKNWVADCQLIRRYVSKVFGLPKSHLFPLCHKGNRLRCYLKGISSNNKETLELLQDESSLNSFPSLEEVENIIGYKFHSRDLLHHAFTHPSYHKDCVSYERLEYVGDSVINLLITKQQFSKYPDLPPGLLTPLRAANVDTEKLARVAIRNNFHKYIRHGNPILTRRIQTFIDSLPKHPLHSHGLIDAPKVLADVVESTVGAVFIDTNCSIDTTWKVAKYILKPIITPEMLQTNPVKKLFEICQKNKLKVRLVDLWSQEGSYQVFIDNKLKGKGTCHKKKDIALNRAANNAYMEVVRTLSLKNLNDIG